MPDLPTPIHGTALRGRRDPYGRPLPPRHHRPRTRHRRGAAAAISGGAGADAQGCRATGVDLLDHLILGSARRWVSLREQLSW